MLLLSARVALQEARGNPGDRYDERQTDDESENVADDRFYPFVRIDPADRASRVVTNSERRREQADTHRQDDHHRVVHLVHTDLPRDRKHQRSEQHDGGYTFENRAEHDKGERGYDEKDRRTAWQGLESSGQCRRESGLGERPGHAGRSADDKKYRPRKAGRRHQHRIDPVQRELAIDEKADHNSVEDADGRHFRRRRDALDYRSANDKRQQQRRKRNGQRSQNDLAGRTPHCAQVLAPIAPPHEEAERDTEHEARQHSSREEGRDRYARHRADGDQNDGRG